jgi:hypothetical protein
MAGSRENAWRTRGGATGNIIDKPFGRHSRVLSDFAPLQRSNIIKKLNPDQKGALRLAARFGDRLVCVRYRTDPASGRRFTTVEIVVEERSSIAPESAFVLVRVNWNETELRRAIKAHGGIWLQERKLWRVPREAVSKLKIKDRVLQESA